MNPTGARYAGRGEWGAVRRCVHEGEVDLNRKRTRNGRSSRASRKSHAEPLWSQVYHLVEHTEMLLLGRHRRGRGQCGTWSLRGCHPGKSGMPRNQSPVPLLTTLTCCDRHHSPGAVTTTPLALTTSSDRSPAARNRRDRSSFAAFSGPQSASDREGLFIPPKALRSLKVVVEESGLSLAMDRSPYNVHIILRYLATQMTR
jgi:hypothetical protein